MRLAVLAPILALSMAASACGGTAASALATATPAHTLDLALRDTAYDAPRLELAAHEVTDLRLTNTGALDHDFTIDRMPADVLVLGTQSPEHTAHASKAAAHAAPGPGKSITLRVHPDATGEYVFYCSIAGHREAGMTGTLVVR